MIPSRNSKDPKTLFAAVQLKSAMTTLFTLSIRTPQLKEYNLLPYVVSKKIGGRVANSVDPDEMLHSAASHLGLHYLLRPVCLGLHCSLRPFCQNTQ